MRLKYFCILFTVCSGSEYTYRLTTGHSAQLHHVSLPMSALGAGLSRHLPPAPLLPLNLFPSPDSPLGPKDLHVLLLMNTYKHPEQIYNY